jgi:16S rRNA uridine-516 pseudouridylate synthase and related pseudouridylate synthases
MQNKMRIAKFIANAGFCSRREAEKLIQKKIVKINNNLCLHPSETVNKDDLITIENKIIKLNKSIRLWKMHKPIKYICSTKDERNRKTIFDLIPSSFPRIISIGR